MVIPPRRPSRFSGSFGGCRYLSNEGIETELIQLAGKASHGCIACYKCSKNKDQKSAVPANRLNEYLGKMIKADGILLGSPVYFADATAGIKVLIERCGMVSAVNGGLFKKKAVAAVTAVRRGCSRGETCRSYSQVRHAESPLRLSRGVQLRTLSSSSSNAFSCGEIA